jgi:hypothetical protein
MNLSSLRCLPILAITVAAAAGPVLAADAPPPAPAASAQSEGDLQIEVNKKGLGKEVVLRKGAKEWYMLIEVTESNSVVLRQEKEHETFLMDESETHDHAMSRGEVDAAIQSFIDSVKMQIKKKQ